jgi:hypothetical protein
MKTRDIVRSFALALCSLFLGSADSAQAIDVSDRIGGACVPDSATVRAGVYETRGFGVGFSGNNTGKIRLLCPFLPSDDALGKKIGITFLSVIDQDGIEAGAGVSAHFRRAGIGSNVAITNGICDLNTSSIMDRTIWPVGCPSTRSR